MVEWYWIPIAVVAVIAIGCFLLSMDSSDSETAELYKKQYRELAEALAPVASITGENKVTSLQAQHNHERKLLGLDEDSLV